MLYHEIDEVFARYEQICAVYPRLDSDMVSCHMDLKPENIVFDGRRVWLVGWQAAFVNDRYFDLAVAANFVVTGAAEESVYLDQYFGRLASEYERARFFLMRQVVHMLSSTVFLLLGAAGKPLPSTDEVPAFGDFHQRIWTGELDLAADDRKIAYGLVHWEQLLQNTRHSRFDEALQIVSERNRSGEEVQLLLPAAP